MNDYNALYCVWKEKCTQDEDLIRELAEIEGKDEEILDRFYQSLAFGTGGLRGVLGAGTNRLNIYTVGAATQGLADYLNEDFTDPTVAIGYDSRNKSALLAQRAACVLAANGIKAYLFKELIPTPVVAWAVRRLSCSSGIVITASHNPAKYNGYKCYDPRGYQMTDEAADKTLAFINRIDIFDDVKYSCSIIENVPCVLCTDVGALQELSKAAFEDAFLSYCTPVRPIYYSLERNSFFV